MKAVEYQALLEKVRRIVDANFEGASFALLVFDADGNRVHYLSNADHGKAMALLAEFAAKNATAPKAKRRVN
jgi:hypothetical protein